MPGWVNGPDAAGSKEGSSRDLSFSIQYGTVTLISLILGILCQVINCYCKSHFVHAIQWLQFFSSYGFSSGFIGNTLLCRHLVIFVVVVVIVVAIGIDLQFEKCPCARERSDKVNFIVWIFFSFFFMML